MGDNNAQNYFRFSDNGRIFMITDVDSPSLPKNVVDSFSNASKFFTIVLSALKQAGKTSFDYAAIQKIFKERDETIWNKTENKSIRPGNNNFTKLNELLIAHATNNLPIQDSSLTVAKNILAAIRNAMYEAFVVNKSDERIAYPILYLESYGGLAFTSFKIYSVQSSQIELLKIYRNMPDGTHATVYESCEYYAYPGNFDYNIEIYDFINTSE